MKAGLILVMTGVIAIPAAYADNISITSSSAVTFLSNDSSTNTDFPSAFTTANFNSAQTGSHAAVLTTTPFYVTSASLTGAGAQWIGTSAGAGNGSIPGYTALFAISFTIPDPLAVRSLTLNYEVDNELGDINPGIYLNGIALPNSTGIPGFTTAAFTTLQTYTDANITADIVQGTNWLYIDAVNLGLEEGLIFSADVSSSSVVPEPASCWLLGAGLVALGVAMLGKVRGVSL